MARKAIEWTEKEIEQFKELCSIFCTEEEICSILGVTDKTLVRLINKHLKEEITPGSRASVSFDQAFAHYSSGGRSSLRREQYKAAMSGNWDALKWLGKQYLGQTDKTEVRKETRKVPKKEEAKPIDDISARAALLNMPSKD